MSEKQTINEGKIENMKKKKSLFFRPVAWIATILLMLGLQFVAELLCKLGGYLVYWLSGMSTVVIILLAMAFGGTFLSVFFYSAIMLPSVIVNLSDNIYPSNHAFRYYFVGLYELVACGLLIFMALNGMVSGGSMFWFYARYGWLAAASVIMMVVGNGNAKDRHESEIKTLDQQK